MGSRYCKQLGRVAVRQVAEEICRATTGHTIIVNKSAAPPGTGDMVREIVERACACRNVSFDVVSGPEFLREGCAIHDALNPDRVVLGDDRRDAFVYYSGVSNGRNLYDPDEMRRLGFHYHRIGHPTGSLGSVHCEPDAEETHPHHATAELA